MVLCFLMFILEGELCCGILVLMVIGGLGMWCLWVMCWLLLVMVINVVIFLILRGMSGGELILFLSGVLVMRLFMFI